MDTPAESLDFIRTIVHNDLATGKHESIQTRFPPEPNGYLHIGHAKAICLSFGLAEETGGACNLRFDDTNPTREDTIFVEAIRADILWLGFNWDSEHFTSDYFEQLHAWAIQLVEAGKAYVCDLSPDEARTYRGTLTEPGKPSPCRDRAIAENVDLFQRMTAGEFEEGTHVLRAKIDVASPNLNLRDPVMYRILKEHHHRTGDRWSVYPMYDWAHGQSDSIERITHSLCSLEFENHRPLYDWYVRELGIYAPRQIEFARFNLSHTVMSKRKIQQLVEEGHVAGWDDPRLPTLSGFRRRGCPPAAIRQFCQEIGMAKRVNMIEIAKLEGCIRSELNTTARRYLGVLRPLKVVITNYPEDQVEYHTGNNNPNDESAGTRQIPFSREFYIEQEDFMAEAPRKYFRLTPGREVRLRYAYFVTCTHFDSDDDGNVTTVYCTYDPETKGGNAPDGRKVKGTIHWVSAAHAISAEVRLYDTLFTVENPEKQDEPFLNLLNPESLTVLSDCKVEPAATEISISQAVQFERQGFFAPDLESTPEALIFNRTVSLRDAWAKIAKKNR